MPAAAKARGDTLYGGSGDDTIGGSPNSDFIVGGTDNDDLYGRLGNDTLTGGEGKDRFIFSTAPSKNNVDRITDFSHRDDSIVLFGDIFAKAGTVGKAIKKGAFWTGSKAHDKDDRIVYDKKSGALYYDPDGTGKAAQVKFATLEKNLKIDHTDFLVLL
jgi:Ca2+-binding RTX toxin-like protein